MRRAASLLPLVALGGCQSLHSYFFTENEQEAPIRYGAVQVEPTDPVLANVIAPYEPLQAPEPPSLKPVLLAATDLSAVIAPYPPSPPPPPVPVVLARVATPPKPKPDVPEQSERPPQPPLQADPPKPDNQLVERDGKLYQLPAQAKTSREDLFRLVDAVDLASRELEIDGPKPTIRIVDRWHKMLRGGAQARTVRTANGNEYIYVNRSFLRSGLPLEGIIMHEMSHVKAWRVYGTDIREHGIEFNRICRSVTSRMECGAYDERARSAFF